MNNKLENKLWEYLVNRNEEKEEKEEKEEEEKLEEMEREHKDETELYCAYTSLVFVAVGFSF